MTEIIERAYAETDSEARAQILLEAEKMLASDMPVMPLFVYQDYYLMSKELSHKGSLTSYWSFRNFSKLNWKNYVEEAAD